MNEVYVNYNPYLPELKIQVNGRSLPEYSALIKYKHSPFTEWCSIFFEEIKKEVNDSYSLTFVGTQFEKDIFEKLSNDDRLCDNFVFEFPQISTDIMERLADLQTMGDVDKDTDLKIGVWSPDRSMTDSFLEMLTETGVFEQNDGLLTSEECPLTRIIVQGLYASEGLGKCDLGFVFLENEPETYLTEELERFTRPLFVVIASGQTGFREKKDNLFIFETDGDDTTDLFLNIIMSTLLPNVLSERSYTFEKLVNSGEVLLTEDEKYKLNLLCATWPQFRVDFPDRMYVGRRSTIHVVGADPQTGNSGFRVQSMNGLCAIDGMTVEAKNPGMDELRVYSGGDPDPIATAAIRILDKITVSEIKVFPKIKYLAEGVEDSIDITVLPENAANLDELRVDVQNSDIVSIENNKVIGLKTGSTSVRFSTPDVETMIQIVVQSHIKDIVIPSANIFMKAGETVEWKPEPDPADCFEKEHIRIVSSKDSVATYRGGYIVAGAQGNATIVITSPDGRIRKECHVEVKKAGIFG